MMGLNAVPHSASDYRNYDVDAVIAKLPQYTVPVIAETYSKKRGLEIRDFAPATPVRCMDYTTCTVAQATLKLRGAIVDHGEYTTVSSAESLSGIAPHGMAFTAIVQLWEGRWLITYWNAELLPEPPPLSP